MVPISAVQHTWFVGELNSLDLEAVLISAKRAYMVCGRAKQSSIRSGSCLSRAAIHASMVCGGAKMIFLNRNDVI